VSGTTVYYTNAYSMALTPATDRPNPYVVLSLVRAKMQQHTPAHRCSLLIPLCLNLKHT